MTSLIDENRLMLERKVNSVRIRLRTVFLKQNVSMTENMTCGSPDMSTIHIGPKPADKSEKLKYFGSTVQESGGTDNDVYSRKSAAWAKWWEITGVVCKIPLKLKGLIYKSNIQSVRLYERKCQYLGTLRSFTSRKRRC